MVVGTNGVNGGYAVSSDGIEGISEKSSEHLWNVAEDVLSQQGTIESADKERGEIKAKIKHSRVKVSLEQATRYNAVVRVKARKLGGIFPDINLARRIYGMVVNEPGEKLRA